VKNMQLSYHAITSYGGIEPPYEVAIPPQAASAEPGDSRVLVETPPEYEPGK
jgi:hypothetical protein